MDLNIRNVNEALVKALKVEAARRGMTLREIVIEKLGSGRDVTPVTAEGQEPKETGELQETEERAGVPPVRGDGGVRVVGRGSHQSRGGAGRVPKKARTCPHGKEKGWHCGLCGGLAKVG